MNAGRELDALIAEKVMGIKVDRSVLNDVKETGCNTCGGIYKSFQDELKYYSADIKDAWEVVERIKTFNPNFYITLQNKWCVGFAKDGANGIDFH